MGGLLNPDARDCRGGNRQAERFGIGREGLLDPPLFGIDGRERAQTRHAPAAIQGHRANRERTFEELTGALPIAERVVVHANSVEAVRLIARGVNFFREGLSARS